MLRSQKKGSLILDIPSLLAQPFPLRLRSLRYAAEKILGNLHRVGLSHILAADRLLHSPEPNQSLQLPQGLGLTKAYHALTLGRSREEVIPFEVSVAGPGCWEIPEIGREMKFEILPPSRVRPKNSSGVALLDLDKIAFPLTIRSFRPGDRLQPLGMEGEKKVKDLFIDCKIPAAQRKKIPLLFKKDQLLWVAGFRLDHRVRLQPKTRRVLRVELV